MRKFRTLAIILIICLTFSVFALACNTKDDNGGSSAGAINLLDKNWQDDNANNTDADNDHAGENVFQFSSGTNKFSPLKTVNKFDAYNAISLNIADLDLQNHKKLLIKGKGKDASAIVKLVSTPIIPGGDGYQEVSINFGEKEEIFEFDLSYDNYASVRKGLSSIIIMPGGGSETSNDIYLSTLEFSNEKANSQYRLNIQAPEIVEPNIYDGTSNTFNILKDMKVNSGNSETLAIDYQDSNTKAVVSVKSGNDAWAYIYSKIGGNLKGFKTLTIEFDAPVGIGCKLKVEGGGVTIKETATADEPLSTGTKVTFSLALEDKNLIDSGEMNVLIFIQPNVVATEDFTFTITKLELSK